MILASLLLIGHLVWAQKSPGEPLDALAISQTIQDSRRQIKLNEKKQREALAHLFEVNKKIKKISKERSDFESEKNFLQVSVKELEEKIQQVKGSIQTEGRELLVHSHMIHQSSDLAWLQIFTGGASPTETDLNLFIFGKLIDGEKQKIAQFLQEQEDLRNHQQKLSTRLARLNQVTNDLKFKEAELTTTQNERRGSLKYFTQNKQKFLAKIKKVKDTDLFKKLEDSGLLDGALKPAFWDERGKLVTPAEGQITERFGIVKAPQATYYKNHKGIYISTPVAQKIRSVFAGKVAYVGATGGFGSTLILDHGDHFYTVYSSLAKIDVKEGEEVSKNHVLAVAGSSNFYPQPGVYFEVRHFSEPQDPMEWIKKGSL